MARYSTISIINAGYQDLPRRYIQVKYPEIPLDISDIYVYTTRGDRYDTLAFSYYNDPSLWWIISSANPSLGCDSLIPPYGSQIRIPAFSRVSIILSKFDSLNRPPRDSQLMIIE
jgi:hypothetical protein